jgi:hypothetical protein
VVAQQDPVGAVGEFRGGTQALAGRYVGDAGRHQLRMPDAHPP